ncbi:helix-turn-helix domain-containing protein [Pseudalkalibacillus sp. Hm43]|uniref:helix-turn-helix domain-containing protein n=1 Tax=Pseudalkalibacillus sp. Hm43 TaxID=3450742 RepID=UPI003F42D581
MREWLIQARKQKGYTQEQVATQCFIDRSYYAQIEKGTRNPSMEVAKKISTALGVNPSTFFNDQYEEPSFLLMLRNSQMVIAYCNLDLEYVWIFNPHEDFESMNILGKRDDEIANNKGTKEIMAFKQEIIDTGMKMRKKIHFPLSEGENTYDVYGEPIRDKNGKVIGVITISLDVTKRSKAKKPPKQKMK